MPSTVDVLPLIAVQGGVCTMYCPTHQYRVVLSLVLLLSSSLVDCTESRAVVSAGSNETRGAAVRSTTRGCFGWDAQFVGYWVRMHLCMQPM